MAASKYFSFLLNAVTERSWFDLAIAVFGQVFDRFIFPML